MLAHNACLYEYIQHVGTQILSEIYQFDIVSRFSLLLLEPGEIYFQDYTAYFYPTGLAPQEAYKK